MENNDISTKKSNDVIKIDDSIEKKVILVAEIVLILGIVCSIVCAIFLVYIDVPGGFYGTTKAFDPVGLVITASILLSSLVCWCILKVLANISISLKCLNLYKDN